MRLMPTAWLPGPSVAPNTILISARTTKLSCSAVTCRGDQHHGIRAAGVAANVVCATTAPAYDLAHLSHLRVPAAQEVISQIVLRVGRQRGLGVLCCSCRKLHLKQKFTSPECIAEHCCCSMM